MDLRARAQEGSVPAMTVLGVRLLEGTDGVERNLKEAVEWLSRAAHAGASRAQYHLGRAHIYGLGTPPDLVRGCSLLQLAAENGEFFAAIELARVKDRGKNPSEARQWYAAALSMEDDIEECDELDEAKRYLASHAR